MAIRNKIIDLVCDVLLSGFATTVKSFADFDLRTAGCAINSPNIPYDREVDTRAVYK